jgi:dTDP-glucose 4,6-dehydratase
MRPHDGRAIPTFVRQALEGVPLTVLGDGSQTRSFLYVDDLVRALVLLAESDEHLPINLGNPREVSLEAAETVIRVTGSRSKSSSRRCRWTTQRFGSRTLRAPAAARLAVPR